MYLLIILFVFTTSDCVQVRMLEERTVEPLNTSFKLPNITGHAFNHLAVDSLEFESRDSGEAGQRVNIISDFPKLAAVYIDNFSLEKLPIFRNLPQLLVISAENNTLTSLSNNSFSHLGLTDITFLGNQITYIEDNTFGKNVTYLMLNCNRLTSFSYKWFKKPESMQELFLKGNRIKYLPGKSLQKFIKLTTLDLSHNQISTISRKALTGPSHMKYFNLAYNKISEIKQNVFPSTIRNIEYLNIQYNRLNFLSTTLLRKIKLQKLGIRGNPWECHCLKNLHLWMSKENITESYKPYDYEFNDDDPVCIASMSHPERCSEIVEPELYSTFIESLSNVNRESCI